MGKLGLGRFAAFIFVWAIVTILPSVVPAAEIEVFDGLEPGRKLILIRGPIEPGDDTIFYEMAKQADRASVLLESEGGAVETGLSIGSEIAMRGFATLVLDGGGCHSICAVIWISGARRYMSPDANISVHAAYRLEVEAIGNTAAHESGVANAMIGAYLNEVGLSREAIAYFTVARPDEPLLPITPDIAQRLDIDVYIQDGAQVTKPEDRPTPSSFTQRVREYAGMSLNCGDLIGVDPQVWLAEAKTLLRQGHDLFGGETFVPLISEAVERTKSEVERDGIIQWCIAAESHLRSVGLPTGIVGPSFDCGRAETPTEFTICGSKDMWVLDRAMANLYFLYKRNASGRRGKAFMESQRKWLQKRDDCGLDQNCLMNRYASRLIEFAF